MSTTAPKESLRGADEEYVGPPPTVFLAEEWHHRDLRACFRPRWLVAGHIDELGADPNAFLTFALGSEEVVVRRAADGSLRAFSNVCTHRGTRLCRSRLGVATSGRIVCPYHSWVFSSDDGSLLRANHMHEDFDADGYGLRRVHVEECIGLIFVCLDETPPVPPSQFLAAIDFAGRDMARMKLAHSRADVIGANWKVVVENNSECYHCVANHPELSAVYDWRDLHTTEEEFVEYCEARGRGEDEVWQMDARSYHTIDNRVVVRTPTPLRAGAETSDDELGSYVGWEPGVALNVSRDMVWIFVPKPVGPQSTELRQMWLVNEKAVEGRDYEIDAVTEFWRVTMRQDRDLCEAVQSGMRDPGFRPGPLNRRHQRGQAGFYQWYARQVRQSFDGLDPHDP